MTAPPKSLKELFLSALEVSPADRAAWLDRECSGDTGLRQQLGDMLAAHEEPHSLLDQTAIVVTIKDGQPIGGQSLSPIPGTQIGHYKLREQIGEGGFGVVYVAEQTEPVRRKVALKIIKPGMDTREVIARFEAERQALALMDHPNVAKVLDAGTTEQGRPFFVMELVKGVSITEFCDTQKLSAAMRLSLFIDVCRAVQHAHQKGIIHRDLKPSNVMITMHDDKAVVKVIDFGVAKALSQKLTEKTVYTAYHQMLGTPLYMAPEQAQLSGLDIDTRSDVYSLGVLLYELLSGTTPFDQETLRRADFDELRRIIREEEPPRPSARVSTLHKDRLSTICDQRQVDPRQLRQSLRGELDWIVMKALEKDRNRRYGSPSALAEDLQRYLDGEPVLACPPTVAYRLTKLATKHRGILAAALLIASTLVGCAVVASVLAVRAIDESERAGRAELKAEAAKFDAEQQAAAAAKAAAEARNAREQEIVHRQQAERALYRSDMRLAASHVENDRHSEAMELLIRQYLSIGPDLGWEWNYLLGAASQSLQTWGVSGTVDTIDWNPDGTWIAISHFGAAEIWNAETAELVRGFPDGRTLKLGIAWHPQGDQLAWGSASDQALLRIWDESSDTVTVLDPNTESIWEVDWSSDGSRLVLGARTSTWDDPAPKQNLVVVQQQTNTTELKVVANRFVEKNVSTVQWNADDTLICVAQSGPGCLVLDGDSLEVIAEVPGGRHAAAWHPTRNWLAAASGSSTSTCLIYDVESAKIVTTFEAHTSRINSIKWSPDGRWLASCASDGFVKIWNVDDWTLHQSYSGHSGDITGLAWHPDSDRVASGGKDRVVNIWPLKPRNPEHQLVESGPTFFWTSENHLRSLSGSHSVVDRDPRNGKVIRKSTLPSGESWKLHRSGVLSRRSNGPSGETTFDVIALQGNGNLSQRLEILAESPGGLPLAMTKDQSAFVATSKTQRFKFHVQLYDFSDSGPKPLTEEPLYGTKQLSWSPNGNWLAVAGKGRKSDGGNLAHAAWVHLLNRYSSRENLHFQVGDRRLGATTVAWKPDSSSIVAGTEDGLCEVFDIDGTKTLSRQFHRGRVRAIAWHPGGKRIASVGDDSTINIWDVATGSVFLSIKQVESVNQLEWSPNGQLLAAQMGDNTVRVWDGGYGLGLASSQSFYRRVAEFCDREFEFAITGNDIAAAKNLILTRLALDSDADWWSYYWAALLCAALDDRTKYTETCQQMLSASFARLDNKDPSAVHFVAWTCALAPDAVDDYQTPVGLAQRSVSLNNENQQSLRGLGAILMRAGDFERAKETLIQALDVVPSKSTSTVYIRYFLAITEHHLGNHEEAGEQLVQANRLAEKELQQSVAWNRKLTLELLRDEAEQLMGLSAEDRSKLINQYFAETTADKFQFLMERAAWHEQRAEYDLALVDVRQAVKLEPTNLRVWQAWNRISLDHYRPRNWQGAEVEARLAIELADDDAIRLFHLAPLLLLAGQQEEYRQLCLHILDEGIENTLHWARLCGLDTEGVIDPQRLIELTQQAVDEVSTKTDWSLWALGRAFSRAGEYETGIKWLQKALDMQEVASEPLISLDMAIAHARWGHHDEARELLERATRLLHETQEWTNHGHRRIEIECLRQEAERLILGSEMPSEE